MRKKVWLLCFAIMILAQGNLFAAFSSKGTVKTDSAVTDKPAAENMQQAMKDFNNLSRHEQRSRLRQMRKAIKDYKMQKKEGNDVSTNTLLLIIIAILIPPLAVYLHEGSFNDKFWISVLLTVLGYVLFSFAGIFFLGSLPGIIYALYVLLSGA